MKKVSKGKLTTINQLRGILAKKYKTTTACPIVTGIFIFDEYLNALAVIGSIFIILSGILSIPAQYRQLNT